MKLWTVAALGAITLFSVGCGKDGVIAASKSAADTACACADYDCAKGAVAAFNKISYQQSDKVEGLSGDDKKAYDANVDRMSDCRDKLK
jgi:hypothetical protein